MIMLQPRRISVDSNERMNINQKNIKINNKSKMKISTISKSSACKTSTSMIATKLCRKNLDRKNAVKQSTTITRSNLPTQFTSSTASAARSFGFTSTYNIATYILLAVILYSSTLCMAQFSGKYQTSSFHPLQIKCVQHNESYQH